MSSPVAEAQSAIASVSLVAPRNLEISDRDASGPANRALVIAMAAMPTTIAATRLTALEKTASGASMSWIEMIAIV